MRSLIMTVLVVALSSSSVAWAERGSRESRPDPAYLEAITEGHRLFHENDRQGALRSYQRALEVQRNDPLAVYFIACAQRALDNLDEAIESFRRAALLAGDEDPSVKVRALMNIAFIYEAQRNFDAAREAWRAYISYAEGLRNVETFIPNARQRLDVITAWEELDAAYAPVRQRIQERADSNE